MRIAYFDCFNGASGDMIVGALIHAGADVNAIRTVLQTLPLTGYRIRAEAVTRHGLAATRFHVVLEDGVVQPHRHLQDIRRTLGESQLSDRARSLAQTVFERLGAAEAAVHGIVVDEVHFHEVGAVDAIVDVVAAVVALEFLGVEEVRASAIPVGSGTVACEHGVLPVPAPATVELLKGVPLAMTDEPGELTTPTGAALLTSLAGGFGPLPTMRIQSIGYGAGSREGVTRANFCRAILGTRESSDKAECDEIVVLETNLDDTTPQVISHCTEKLLAEGALDVYVVPIVMKKSRPGFVLTVLCEPGDAATMEDILFRETATFGIRRHDVRRSKLRRRHETVTTPWGEIRVKVGQRGDVVSANPEYEDCKRIALERGISLQEMIEKAKDLWRQSSKRTR